MGLVIENHPKMVAMWVKRVRESNAKYGPALTNKWAQGFFTKEQLELIMDRMKGNSANT